MKKTIILLLAGVSILTAQDPEIRIVPYEDIEFIREQLQKGLELQDPALRDTLKKYEIFFKPDPDFESIQPQWDVYQQVKDMDWGRAAGVPPLTEEPAEKVTLTRAAGFSLPAAKMAQAAADVMVGRARLTMEQYVLSKFGDEMKKYEGLFSNTSRVMTQAGITPISSMPLVGEALRRDFATLPVSLIEVVVMADTTEVGDDILLALYISRFVTQLLQGAPPLDAFQYIITDEEMAIILDSSETELPRTVADIRKPEQEAAAVLYRSSLILRTVAAADGSLPEALDIAAVMATIKNRIEVYKWQTRYIWPINDNDNLDEVRTITEAFGKLFKALGEITEANNKTPWTVQGSSLVTALDRFLSAVLPSHESKKTAREITRSARVFFEGVATGNYQSILLELSKHIESHGRRIQPNTARALTLAAALAQAETEDAARAALDAFAAPVGTYIEKRKRSDPYIYLNAYVGVGYSADDINNLMRKEGHHVLLYAPIGLEIGNWTKKSWVPSIFIQIIDLAAFTAASIDTSKEALTSQFAIRNIFSPGVGMVWGLCSTPFTLGLLLRSGHALPDFLSGELAYLERDWIFSITLAIDIPLFP